LRASEIRDFTDDEIRERLEQSRQELFNLRFQHATGALENTARMGDVKKQIARLLTLQHERQRVAAGGEG
jgi:large subunit ribosomal protein L29